VEDTVDALRRISARAPELGEQTGTVAVAGDSAGGTLAALACLRLREEPEQLPDLQVLIYSNTDLADEDSPSMREKATGYGYEARMSFFFRRQWVPDRSRWADPGVSPLRAPDLSGVPAAMVITAEHDPLRDQAEAYAVRLREAGVEVLARREPGLVHNFLQFDEISPACAAAADRIAAEIGERLR
jgi:acetyl esterase